MTQKEGTTQSGIAFDIHNTLRIKWMQQVKKVNTNLFVGGGITNFLDVTVNTNYENAAAGGSEFFGPELHALFLQQAPRWLGRKVYFHEGVSLMPFAALLRPGYAYIDNYTARDHSPQ